MKKLISLIASLSLVATMAAPAFAASLATNAPVVETTVTQLTADEYYNDWMEEDLPAGQSAYLVEVSAKGFDLSSVRAGASATKKNNRNGVILMYASYGIEFDNVANVAAVYAFGGFTKNTSEEKKAYCIKNYDDPALAYPVSSSDETAEVTANKIANVQQYIITTTGAVVGTPYAEFKVTEFNNSASVATQSFSDEKANIKYTVNGEAATSITFGATEEPPVTPEPPVVTEDIIVKNYRKITDGHSWEVTINNYDEEVEYVATFTAGEEEKVNVLDFDAIIEADSNAKTSFSFAALLKTSRASVALDVAKN